MLKLQQLGVWIGLCYCGLSVADKATDNVYTQHPFYLGVMGGYGSTTWQGLVPQVNNQNSALSLSTPIKVNEGGGVWGFVAGYEFSPFFAIEANYMRFPNAEIIFDGDYSLFAYEHDGLNTFHSETQTGALYARIMLEIPRTHHMRLFSRAGIATVVRQDQIDTINRISPTFGVGLNFLINPHVMGELGINYTAGYGESEINPVNDFVPFLYALFAKVDYRF